MGEEGRGDGWEKRWMGEEGRGEGCKRKARRREKRGREGDWSGEKRGEVKEKEVRKRE